MKSNYLKCRRSYAYKASDEILRIKKGNNSINAPIKLFGSTLVYIHVSPVLVYNKSFYVCYTSWVYVINHVFICFRIKTTITSSKEGICGGFDNMLESSYGNN
jgi:hypothetical protein